MEEGTQTPPFPQFAAEGIGKRGENQIERSVLELACARDEKKGKLPSGQEDADFLSTVQIEIRNEHGGIYAAGPHESATTAAESTTYTQWLKQPPIIIQDRPV